PTSSAPRLWMQPWLAVLPPQEPVGLVVADRPPRCRIPSHLAAEMRAHVGKNAARRRDVALFDIRYRPATLVDRRQEVDHVPSNRRRHVLLQFLFGLVFRILLQLVSDIAMDRRAAVGRREVVAVDAGAQGALVTIERRRPRILRVRRVAPRA